MRDECSVDDYNKVMEEISNAENEIEKLNVRVVEIERFINNVSAVDKPMVEFDEKLFNALVDKIVVGSEVEIVWNGMCQ